MNLKKIAISILAFAMLLTVFVIPASATTISFDTSSEESLTETATPRWVVSCPSGGRHRMYAKGASKVYQGSYQNPGSMIFSGYCFQCSQCRLVLASEGSPLFSGVLGRYCLRNFSDSVSYVTYFYGGIDGSFYGNLIQDSYWNGFEFY